MGILLVLLFVLFKAFKYFENSKMVIKDRLLVDFLINRKLDDKKLNNVFKGLIKINMPYNDLVSINSSKVTKIDLVHEEAPFIYLYNTHQGEEYASNQFDEYSIKPTVMMPSYIMEDVFNKNNIPAIVEEGSIQEILNRNKLNYAGSYKASRYLMEEAKKKYPTLKYFIDIHRDSISHDKSYISINRKDYAKILFIVGMENPNYALNLKFTETINNKIDELYPGLSRGIYKKSGIGVNGVYNQDNNPYTILIEIGGEESTIDEVMNSTLAFIECFIEVIKHEG